jgi:NAD(P)-dependent dehydrogenase (short-subunit alcohol dehydrogenase family)
MSPANRSAYTAAKAAPRSYVRTWAAEFKDNGIRANALSRGVVGTPMADDRASTMTGLVIRQLSLFRMFSLARTQGCLRDIPLRPG